MNSKLKIFLKKKIIDFKKYEKFKIWGVDSSIFMYIFNYIYKDRYGFNFRNKEGISTGAIYGFYLQIIEFLDKKILPLYFFEGVSPKIKYKEIMKRKKKELDLNKKIENLKKLGKKKEDEELIRLRKKQIFIERNHDSLLMDFFTLSGIPYVLCEGEIDPTITYFKKKNLINEIFTRDFDVILFGSDSYIRKEKINKDTFEKNYVKYYLDESEKKGKLIRKNIIDMGIILGTDYNSGIKGIGIKTLEKNLEKISEFKKKFNKEELIIKEYYENKKKNKGNKFYLIENKENYISDLLFYLENMNFSSYVKEKYLDKIKLLKNERKFYNL